MSRLWQTIIQEKNNINIPYPPHNPYKIVGNNIYHYKNGKWSIKQRCKSSHNAKAALRLLQGIEHGMKPRR